MNLCDLSQEKVLILGAGLEGMSVYRYLRSRDSSQNLILADQKEYDLFSQENRNLIEHDSALTLECGSRWLSSILKATVIIKSPGISLRKYPVIQQAQESGIPVIGATDLFLAACPGVVIGVTGSKGKSTTSSLIAHLLSASHEDVRLVGNIGKPALDQLAGATPATIFVYEMSSYQCENLVTGPQYTCFVSFFPDHLDYHGDLKQYFEAKAGIIRGNTQASELWYNKNNAEILELIPRFSGSLHPFPDTRTWYLGEGAFCYGSPPSWSIPWEDCPLLGHHNRENVLCALSVATRFGVPFDALQAALRTFRPLPHRLEEVGSVRGIRCVNDAISTTPESTIQAVKVFKEQLGGMILGGTDRGYQFEELAAELAQTPIHAVALFPDTGSRIEEALRQAFPQERLPRFLHTRDMAEAVAFLLGQLTAGEVMLLSTASPSYSLFTNFEHKGRAFAEALQSMSHNQASDPDDQLDAKR